MSLNRIVWHFALFSMPCLASLQVAIAKPSYETIALTEDDFSFLGSPTLSNKGTVAFYGQVEGGAGRGIWYGLPGDLGIVARDGSPAPGIDGATFEDFDNPILSPGGKIAFGGSLNNEGDVTAANDTGIWTGLPSAPALVAREGMTAPGTDFEFFSLHGLASGSITVNDNARVAFFAHPEPTSRLGSAVWIGGAGQLELVAMEDLPAPGTNNDFQSIGDLLVLNGSGSVAFSGFLAGANSSEDQARWIGPVGGVELLMREGQVAPGTEGGRYVSPNAPVINAKGNAAFVSAVVGSNTGIWVGKAESLELLALNGMEAPGTGGALFESFFTPIFSGSNIPLINANDQVAFLAALATENDNNLGLWRGAPGDMDLMARTGTIAPGTGGQTFQDIDLFTINSNDDVAYTARVADGEGLWVNVNGRNSLVVLEGQLFDVDPTEGVDLREIQDIHFEGDSGGQDGRRMSFNDRNTVLFQLDFTDGSTGIFTASVPEPSSLVLIVICWACLLWRR